MSTSTLSMATSNSTPCPFSAVLSIFLFFQLLVNKATSSDSISFNFVTFGPDVKDIIFQGDAILSKGTIQLTETDESGNPVQSSAGRALYHAPVHLWEETTGRLASFYTVFTFIIITPANGSDGDGLTFFIAPLDSQIPSSSAGGVLAIFNPDTALNTSLNQVVAVEFDTFSDAWDPYLPHIGIDVSSIKSVETNTIWEVNNVLNGSVATAQVNYDSISKTLRANLSYGADGAGVMTVIDLRSVLPEWVRVGFSGSTGSGIETNNVLSWSFTSYLDGNRKMKTKIF